MSFEAYKLAVAISLTENVTRGLSAMSVHFAKANSDAERLNNQLLKIGKTAMLGGALGAMGSFGLKALQGPLEAAKEYEKAQAKFETLNLGTAMNAQADSFARGTKAFGASSKDLMNTLRESYGMIGDMDMAKKIAPTIASLNAANAVLFKDKAAGGKDDGATQSIMRFIDMRGLTNSPEEIKRGIDLAQKIVTGSGGALKFSDLEQFAKRGGVAFKGMSDDGVMMMATMMQEMGGASAGTGLMSAYQNLVGGRTTKKSMAALQDLGLANLGYVSHGTVGGKDYKTLQIKDIQDKQTLLENFPKWVMDNVIPAMEKKGITDTSQQAEIVNSLLSQRTGASLGVGFATQFLQTLRDKKMVENAMGVDQAINAAQRTTVGKEADFAAKLENLKLVIGKDGGLLDAFTKGLVMLGDTIERVTKFAQDYPTLTKLAVLGFAAFSALAVLAGGLLLFKAALMALRLTSTVGAISGLGSSLFGLLGPIARLTGSAIPSLLGGMTSLAAKMPQFFTALGQFMPQAVAGSIALAAGYAIGEQLNKILSKDTKDGIGQAGMRVLSFFDVGDARKLVHQMSGGELYKNQGYENSGVNLTAEAKARLATLDAGKGSPNIRTGGPAVNVTVVNKVDERGITNMVTKNMANQMNKPNASAPVFDYNAGFPQVGLAR